MEEPKSTAKRRTKTSVPVQEDKITLLPLSELHDFPNHPFKVRDDEAMQETAESIRQYRPRRKPGNRRTDVAEGAAAYRPTHSIR